MTEKEILNAIKKSADQIEIPDSLAPEQITLKLQKKKRNSAKIQLPPLRKLSSAAAVFLLCGLLSAAAWNARQILPESSPHTDAAKRNNTAKENYAEDSGQKTDSEEMTKQDAGSLYTVAKSYSQIQNALKTTYQKYSAEKLSNNYAALKEETADMAATGESAMDTSESRSSGQKDSYSKTNLQTEGVDESDIVKTDGRYIYSVTEQKVRITDTADDSLTAEMPIQPDLDPSDSILELYVDHDKLLLFVQKYVTTLEEAFIETPPVTNETEDDSFSQESCLKKNYVQTTASTVLYVYDITNPKEPSLTGTAEQDGYYQTSRKIGDMLYLFTGEYNLADTFSSEKLPENILPCINGKEISYDHVYLPEEGSSGLILSSININNPEEIVDNVMIIHDYVDIYVGNHSVYLYHANYEGFTEIAKFSIDNGKINAVNAASVKGYVYDTFAINESNNTLRILTTSYDTFGNSNNSLYLFDENLTLAGSLSGIAKGEEIYAARYFENTAYFITYRNTDPLFSVDISDISNPILLGELKITGFSDYLHFWEEDKLFGIGYETDPDTGEIEGLKLVMFDISDPADLKVIDSLILEKYSYSPALHQYKTVLPDSVRNLIGFTAESNDAKNDYCIEYNIYAWENNHFTKKLVQRLPSHINSDYVRGIYIGNTFYIADTSKIASFEMENNFKKIKQLDFNE